MNGCDTCGLGQWARARLDNHLCGLCSAGRPYPLVLQAGDSPEGLQPVLFADNRHALNPVVSRLAGQGMAWQVLEWREGLPGYGPEAL